MITNYNGMFVKIQKTLNPMAVITISNFIYASRRIFALISLKPDIICLGKICSKHWIKMNYLNMKSFDLNASDILMNMIYL